MKKLKELRLERKLSQEALAERVGTVQPQVSDWENGKVSPTIESLRRLAKALGVKPGELL